jgi:single-strand DNA-binding protein
MNSINITGFIATEPKQNTAGVSFILAVHRAYQSKDGVTADFMPVSAFGRVADVITDYAHKGSKLGITGSIKTSKYMDKDGNEHNGWEVIAREVFLLDSKPTTKPYTKAKPKSDFPDYVRKDSKTLDEKIAELENQLGAMNAKG